MSKIEYDVLAHFPRTPEIEETTICPTLGQARKLAKALAADGKVATVYRVQPDSLDFAYGADSIVHQAAPE